MSDPLASPLPTPIPLPDELREMREKEREALAELKASRNHPDQLDAWLAAQGKFNRALRDWFDTLTATKPSGQVEKLRTAVAEASWFMRRHGGDEFANAIEAALAALSTQVQTAPDGGSQCR